MVIHCVSLEDFVQTFEQERPKAINRAVIADLLENVSDKVEIWLDAIRVYLYTCYFSGNRNP